MSSGTLVIVGGAEILHHKPIVSRFVELAGGPGGPFLILASATAAYASKSATMRSWFIEAGVQPEDVEVARISLTEAGMERGAWDEVELGKLRRAKGLWLLGGDQNRTTSLLRAADGADSPFLALLRERAAKAPEQGGLVVGGTSAGAAVLSDPMIGAGTSFGALALPRARGPGQAEMSRALYVLPGFGLFPEGMVDQHFDTRSRFARLVEAALVEDGARRLAFGIAEATALVYIGARRRVEVVGPGGIYLIDPRRSRRSLAGTAAGPRLKLEEIVFHYLTEGDAFDAARERISWAPGKEEIGAGEGAFASEGPEASGPLSSYGGLADFAARMLLDNEPALLYEDRASGRRYARGYLIEEGPLPGGGSAPLAWEIRVGRYLPRPDSDPGPPVARLFYDGRYGFEQVFVDILPIDLYLNRE